LSKTIVVGDGPGGLSAAIFLAKNGHQVTVYGRDETAMHHALLHNYLGFDEIHGSDLQTAGRRQVERLGGSLVEATVGSIAVTEAGVSAELEDGRTDSADYLVLTEGRNPILARSLGLAEDDGAIRVDRNGRSSVDRVYVVGRSVRPARSQAIISAGDGAAAALDILSREAGKDIRDWDSPPKE
jgi:thioredoxin reductase